MQVLREVLFSDSAKFCGANYKIVETNEIEVWVCTHQSQFPKYFLS
jgi:hypothetical protein